MEWIHNAIAFSGYMVSNTALTPTNSNHIYMVWVESFYDFIDYLTTFVYDRAINQSVLDFSIALLFFMLFLSFVVGFIFIAPKK